MGKNWTRALAGGEKARQSSSIAAVAREFEMKRIERTRTNNTFENFDYESKIGLILDSRHACVTRAQTVHPEARKNLTRIFKFLFLLYYEFIKLYIMDFYRSSQANVDLFGFYVAIRVAKRFLNLR